ncbi:MAG: ABC transporter ATP-binding protein [Cyanobacteria bacterium J06633_2]
MTQTPVLHLDSVTRQFDSAPTPAVCSVTLTLFEQELLGLLGPSGCGKTTLLRLIAGFERPQTGSIFLSQRPVAGEAWTPPEQRGIGMVFQDYALFPHLTVGKNVAFGLHQRKTMRSPAIKQRVQEVLALVGLDDMEQRFPHQLSGGQQQRVALARALAPYPQMVLLDEPLSNLDAKVRLQLRQELREIIKAAGASGIFVTHDQEEALSICDRVAVMRDGRIEQIGSPEDLYQVPISRFVANFVAQANFIPARWQAGDWHTELGTIAHTSVSFHNSTVNSSPLKSGDRADLLVRQEDLMITPNDAGAVVIRNHQFLGRENRYTLITPSGQHLIARTPADVIFSVGQRVDVAIASDRIQIFPAEHAAHHIEV